MKQFGIPECLNRYVVVVWRSLPPVQMPKFTAMDSSAAARIQSATCRANGGVTPAGSFAARAQSAASTNANNSNSTTSKK